MKHARRSQRSRARLVAVGAMLAACGQSLRVAPTGPYPVSAEHILVDYPPPPAKVEVTTEDPGEPCVWVDGHWRWIGRRWQWATGGWVVPPQGCYYAPARMGWAQTSEGPGLLYYAPPRWYPKNVDELGRDAALAQCREVESCEQESLPGPRRNVR